MNATLVFTDESGFLLAPLVRSSLSPMGQTPILRHRAKHRDKVSAAAALTLSPRRGHVSLYYHTYPDHFVDVETYAHFMHALAGHLRRNPLMVLQDQGGMHKGEPLRRLCAAVPRLHLNMLPPYAPELNPVEYLWTHTKGHRLGNFVPQDIPTLDRRLCRVLNETRVDQDRLRSFFAQSPLPWDGLTVFF